MKKSLYGIIPNTPLLAKAYDTSVNLQFLKPSPTKDNLRLLQSLNKLFIDYKEVQSSNIPVGGKLYSPVNSNPSKNPSILFNLVHPENILEGIVKEIAIKNNLTSLTVRKIVVSQFRILKNVLLLGDISFEFESFKSMRLFYIGSWIPSVYKYKKFRKVLCC